MRSKIIVTVAAALFCSCGDSEKTAGTAQQQEQEAPITGGQKIFINNCIQCHNIKTDKIGPRLEGSFARWNNDTARFSAFIRNSQEIIKSGDPRAVAVYKEWNNALMTPMPHLTDNDIKELLEYINKGVE